MKIDLINEILKENGYKKSKVRSQIIEAILNKKGYISAEEIFDLLKNRVNLSTIYRNIKLLDELGFLNNIDVAGIRRFKIKNKNKKSYHDIICLGCGVTKVIEFCPLDRIQKNEDEFEIIGHRFEVYGICKSCKKNNE